MDVREMNRVIALVSNGNRDACRNDEERALYDRIKREQEWAESKGWGLDMAHDSD